MPINIQSQPAIIAWQTHNAKLEQSGNGGLILDLQSSKPELEMQTKHPKIQIDQSECFAEEGHKNMTQMREDSERYSKQILTQGIDRIVSDGNQMRDFHIKSDPIASQAEYNAFQMFEYEFNYDAIPHSRPQITLDEGRVNYQFRRHQVFNNTEVKPIKMDYTPGQVSFYLKQYASIQMRYEAREKS